MSAGVRRSKKVYRAVSTSSNTVTHVYAKLKKKRLAENARHVDALQIDQRFENGLGISSLNITKPVKVSSALTSCLRGECQIN